MNLLNGGWQECYEKEYHILRIDSHDIHPAWEFVSPAGHYTRREPCRFSFWMFFAYMKSNNATARLTQSEFAIYVSLMKGNPNVLERVERDCDWSTWRFEAFAALDSAHSAQTTYRLSSSFTLSCWKHHSGCICFSPALRYMI